MVPVNVAKAILLTVGIFVFHVSKFTILTDEIKFTKITLFPPL